MAMKKHSNGLRLKFPALAALAAICCSQLSAVAHAPLAFRFHGVFPANHLAASHLLSTIHTLPLSNASKALAFNLKTTSSAAFQNTVLNTPLINVSGQFTGVSYLSTTPGFGGPFHTLNSNVVPFGSNPLNNGDDTFISGGPVNVPFGNSLMLGASGVVKLGGRLVPSALLAHLVPTSGADRAFQNLYKQAGLAGSSAGIQVLAHPTGGLLFGTTYYQNATFGATDFNIYPGFEAFGNNPFASAAVAQLYSTNPLNLTQPLVSYIQFGKITRYVSNGLLYGTFYFPVTNNPPFGAGVPNPYDASGFFGVAIGSNMFNTGQQHFHLPFPQIFGSSTYFQ